MNAPRIEIVFEETPIAYPFGIRTWVQGIKTKISNRILSALSANTDHLDRYLECAELAGLPGAFVCCSFYQRDLNEVFTRMGIFMGAGRGVSAGTVPRHGDATLINYRKLVAGHNLPAPVISDFFSALSGEADADRAPSPAEAAFHDAFVRSPRVDAYGGAYYVIGVSVQSTKSLESVMTHEILHARYFLEKGYREAVQEFWTGRVSAEDRARIIATIGTAYNVEVSDLAVDEFQAYLLQRNAEGDFLKEFVSLYGASLRKWLAARGFPCLEAPV